MSGESSGSAAGTWGAEGGCGKQVPWVAWCTHIHDGLEPQRQAYWEVGSLLQMVVRMRSHRSRAGPQSSVTSVLLGGEEAREGLCDEERDRSDAATSQEEPGRPGVPRAGDGRRLLPQNLRGSIGT